MKIRIGNDLRLQWKIYKDAEPYMLSVNSKVRLLDVYNKPVPIECNMEDNVINIIYRGRNQHTYGKYTLLLMENEDKDDMLTVDYQYAFELVKHSINADTDQINTNMIIDVPCLTSNVETGGTSYKLPIATATELGGVMPVEKTEDMTVNVGVDKEGKLYTFAGNYDDTQIKQDIANNTSLLGEHTTKIEANTTLIGKNTSDIQQHTADIALNVKKIGEVNDALLLKADKTELENLATKQDVETAKYDDTQVKADIALKADKTELENLATKQEVEAAKYTLPVANETTFGGVKAIAKTDDMTQDVGIGLDGKLYTKKIVEGGGYDDTQVKADIKKNTEAIALKADKTELTNLATKQDVENAKYNDTEIKKDVLANTTALVNKADKVELQPLATKEEVEAAKYNDTKIKADIALKADKSELDNYATRDELGHKQEELISGTNIKTINNQDILGKGNINIESSAPYDDTQVKADIKKNTEAIALKADKTELQPLATKEEVNAKQNTLVSGTNIKTINNQDILGKGNINIEGGTPYDDTQVKADIKTNADAIALKADRTELQPLATKEEVNAKQNTLVSGTNIKTINNQDILGEGNITIEGGTGGGTDIINATYAELKVLKDGNQLVKGQKYRMTDFVTMISGELYNDFETKPFRSAGHAFDLILTAIDVNKFDNKVNAIKHEGDTYFELDKLEKWQVWYSFDNDPFYSWCDPNGKGVIYRMIDDGNNEAPYDFKNIQYSNVAHSNNASYWYYTFNVRDNDNTSIEYDATLGKYRYFNSDVTPGSTDDQYVNCSNNVIKRPYKYDYNFYGKVKHYLKLNRIVLSKTIPSEYFNIDNNIFEGECKDIYIVSDRSNISGLDGNYFYESNNIFATGARQNIFIHSNVNQSNSTGSLFGNIFIDATSIEMLGRNCYNNIFNNVYNINCNSDIIYTQIKDNRRLTFNTSVKNCEFVPQINYADEIEIDTANSKKEYRTIISRNSAGEIVQQIVGDATGGTYDDTQVKADIQANTDAIAAINASLNGADATIANINNIIG